jgi:hypothetical protein
MESPDQPCVTRYTSWHWSENEIPTLYSVAVLLQWGRAQRHQLFPRLSPFKMKKMKRSYQELRKSGKWRRH